MIQKLIVLCISVVTICAAPLQPSVQDLQAHLSPIQQQMLALQQMEMLNRLTAANLPAAMNPSPVLLVLPNFPTIQNMHGDVINNPSELSAKEYLKLKTPINNKEDEDSIVVNSEDMYTRKSTNKAILLLPNRARLSIGDIISSIPWLPIEVNVPDTISWMYNGIAGIISGIGQRFPFQRPQTSQMSPQDNLRVLLKQQQLQRGLVNVLPILVIPIDAPIVDT